MKIVLADCYHDSDKGGGGMVAGAINAIRNACSNAGADAEVSLLFRFSEDDPRFGTAARLTSPMFPGLAILPAPISSRRGPGVHWLSWGLRTTIFGMVRLIAPSLSRHPAIAELREADVIVLKGGNFYKSWSKNAIADWLAMILLFYTAILARRMRKRYVFASHTFGPFETDAARQVVGWVARGAGYISTREARSKEILVECGVQPDTIRVEPDFGFGAYTAESSRTRSLLETHGLEAENFVGFTARPWFYSDLRAGDSSRLERYLDFTAALLDHALDKGVRHAALIVQNDGAHSVNEPDLPILVKIKERMRQCDRALIIDNDYGFDDLCALYGQARFLLGTRLHSCIFSFVAGTPPIAIAYSHKGQGIMSMMGLEKYVLDISAPSIADGTRMIDEVMHGEKALREHIAQRGPVLREALFHSISDAIFDSRSRADHIAASSS